MAGYMYLGNKKVCPAVLVGGGEEQKNCLFRIPDNITQITKKYAFEQMFSNFSYPIDVDFNNLEIISSNSTSSFSNLCLMTSGSFFKAKNLRVIEGASCLAAAFEFGTQSIDVDFSKIESIGNSSMLECFAFASGLPETVSFDSLTSLSNKSLQSCFAGTNAKVFYFKALTSNSFGGYTNAFYNMLAGNQSCVVHFPSSLQSVVVSWSDVVGGFNGTNTTVLFDLPATE